MILALATIALELGGPHATAFAEECQDGPEVACRRMKTLRIGGHPVEIWEEITPGEIQIFVAIETYAGWYTSAAAFTVETEHEGEHCSSSSRISRFEARAIRVDDHHAARVELDVDWESSCRNTGQRFAGRIYRTTTCVVDDAIVPHCDVDGD